MTSWCRCIETKRAEPTVRLDSRRKRWQHRQKTLLTRSLVSTRWHLESPSEGTRTMSRYQNRFVSDKTEAVAWGGSIKWNSSSSCKGESIATRIVDWHVQWLSRARACMYACCPPFQPTDSTTGGRTARSEKLPPTFTTRKVEDGQFAAGTIYVLDVLQ